LAALPPAEAEASSEAELRSRLEQIEALEAQLAALDEAVVRQRAEAEDGARALVASQERIAMLEAALAASGGSADGGGASRTDESDEEDVSFILLSPERTGSTGGVLEPQAIDERQRQLEKKQMMDVLTDFLNK
jgi:hypothetical protein